MKIKFLFGFIIILFLCTCSDEAAGPPSDIPDIEFPMYYGTYLYNDAECGGADIQYATLDEDEITFFDYLGDGCDDTVGCYATNTYKLTELSQDTFLIVSEVGSSITNGEISLDGDSSITFTYEGNNGMGEHSWEKIKDEAGIGHDVGFIEASKDPHFYTDATIWKSNYDKRILERYILCK